MSVRNERPDHFLSSRVVDRGNDGVVIKVGNVLREVLEDVRVDLVAGLEPADVLGVDARREGTEADAVKVLDKVSGVDHAVGRGTALPFMVRYINAISTEDILERGLGDQWIWEEAVAVGRGEDVNVIFRGAKSWDKGYWITREEITE